MTGLIFKSQQEALLGYSSYDIYVLFGCHSGILWTFFQISKIYDH